MVFDAIVAAGLPVVGTADNGPDAVPRFRVDLVSSATQAQRDQAASIAASLNVAQAAQDAYQAQTNRAAARALLTAPDGNGKALRAIAFETKDLVTALGQKINELVAFSNTKGATITPLVGPNWAAIAAAIISQINSGNAD